MSALSLLIVLNSIVFVYRHLKVAVARSLARWAVLRATLGAASLNLFSTRIEGFLPLLICAVIVLDAPARLESDHWWCRPSIDSALALTSLQSVAIGRLCDEVLPLQPQTDGEVTALMNDVARRIHEGAYDDDLLHATERLAAAQAREREIRHRVFERAIQLLTPLQREKLVLGRASQGTELSPLRQALTSGAAGR